MRVDDDYQKRKGDPVWMETKRARDNQFASRRRGKPRMSGTRIPDSDLLKKAIKIYGSECKCCGETESMFLTLDRKDMGPVDMKLAVNEPNHSVYQMLCFNCIMGRRRTGSVCPHKLGEVKWEDEDRKVVSPVAKDSLDKWVDGVTG